MGKTIEQSTFFLASESFKIWHTAYLAREAVKSNQQIKINHEKTINFAKGLNEEVAIKLIDGRPTIETQF